MTRQIPLLFIVFTALFITSCTDSETGSSKNVNPGRVYFDYQVSGEEDDSTVTVLLQYRLGGPHGKTILLDTPVSVTLDGAIIPVDSSRMTGAFYELQLPTQLFTGHHSIVFTPNNQQPYKEDFFFQPLSLKTSIPDSIGREGFILELDGLEAEDYVWVLLTDTSRYSEGISRLDTARNGRVVLSAEDLEGLASGPINLQLIREYERAVKDATPKGGRIVISYGLRREFVLK